MKLWIDDIRPAPDNWLWAKTFSEAIEILQAQPISTVSFDHDLGDGVGDQEKTGYDVALWLAERAFYGITVPTTYYVHSANAVGRQRIERVIERYLT